MSNRYDHLNQLWKQAEDRLRRFNVPTEVVFEYRAVFDPDDQEAEHYGFKQRSALGWAKVNGAWHICHGRADDRHQGEGYVWTPISDCTIDIRQSEVEHFSALRNLVVERAKETIPSLDKAIATLKSALER